MAKYTVNGITRVEVSVQVEASSWQEALDKADSAFEEAEKEDFSFFEPVVATSFQEEGAEEETYL